MLQKMILLLLLIFSYAHAEYMDSDFDGVEDAYDKCPNTPFSDLVDINGCAVKSLVSAHHFDFITGVSYSDSDYQTLNKTDTFSIPLQVDYYYKNFSLQVTTSYFTTSGSGLSDTGFYDSFIGASYQENILENLSLQVGAGILLPTYQTSLNNNKTDYSASLNLSYTFSKASLFAGYSFTLIGDDDAVIEYDDNSSDIINYQNSNAFSLGVGYYMSERLYTSLAYNYSDSIYKSIKPIETASVYAYYSLNDDYFCTLSYAYGISESASKNYASLRIGYFY